MTYGINAVNDMPKGSCSYKDEFGVKHMKKFYRDWHNMLKRCYAMVDRTYLDCYVCDEWLTLSNFKAWFDDNHIDGFQLDKDLMIKGNKEYGPKTCNYVPKHLNNLFWISASSKRIYNSGTVFCKQTGRYAAKLISNGASIWLGRYDTEVEAKKAYKKAKLESVVRTANMYKDVISIALYDAIIERGKNDYKV